MNARRVTIAAVLLAAGYFVGSCAPAPSPGAQSEVGRTTVVAAGSIGTPGANSPFFDIGTYDLSSFDEFRLSFHRVGSGYGCRITVRELFGSVPSGSSGEFLAAHYLDSATATPKTVAWNGPSSTALVGAEVFGVDAAEAGTCEYQLLGRVER